MGVNDWISRSVPASRLSSVSAVRIAESPEGATTSEVAGGSAPTGILAIASAIAGEKVTAWMPTVGIVESLEQGLRVAPELQSVSVLRRDEWRRLARNSKHAAR